MRPETTCGGAYDLPGAAQCINRGAGVADEVRNAEAMLGNHTGSASPLIERERDLLKIREDLARGVDVQASAITAATLALVAVATGCLGVLAALFVAFALPH